MNNRFLTVISVLGEFIAVFPLVVLCEGAAYGEFIWWHYISTYAVYAAFYFCGWICCAWAQSGRHSREFRPKALFLSRAAVTVPIIVFMIVCAAAELSPALYLYSLPSAVILYYGGYKAYGKGYSDIFSRGWFALFFIAGIVSSLILYFTHNDDVMRFGGYQICIAFGLLIVIAAVLTNQTNIDICTHQRDSGRVALPKGLRSYNCGLVAAVVAVVVAMFLFAVPLANLFSAAIKQMISWVISLLQGLSPDAAEGDILSGTDNQGQLAIEGADNSVASVLALFLIGGLVALIIVFRRQIAAFFREIFAPLFRSAEEEDPIEYSDEFSEIGERSMSAHKRRRKEQQLYHRYCKETDPAKKYRIGYRYMLLRLKDTPFPPFETDTTDIHKTKAENGLRCETAQEIVSVYNSVRYGGEAPTEQQLMTEQSFIEQIRR